MDSKKIDKIYGTSASANEEITLPGINNIICVSNGTAGGVAVACEFSGNYVMFGDNISGLVRTSGNKLIIINSFTRYVIMSV